MQIMNKKWSRTLFLPIIMISKFLGRNFPVFFAKCRYFARFHKRLNLKSPKTLNEKILYLSLKTDTSRWSDIADKYRVREYVDNLGLADNLVKLYGVWENANLIDWDALPVSFVLKVNHGSGDVVIVKDKNKINKKEVVEYFNKLLKSKYGELESGLHYYRIKPVVIAEEFILNDEISAKYSTSLIDYKIWCFNGKPYYIWTCCNRDKLGTDVMTYDLKWNAHPEWSRFNSHYRRGDIIPKPVNFDEMLNIASKLSQGFPCTRIDLYNLKGTIYFGEVTFTSLGGLMNFYTDDFLLMAGSKIDLYK